MVLLRSRPSVLGAKGANPEEGWLCSDALPVCALLGGPWACSCPFPCFCNLWAKPENLFFGGRPSVLTLFEVDEREIPGLGGFC